MNWICSVICFVFENSNEKSRIWRETQHQEIYKCRCGQIYIFTLLIYEIQKVKRIITVNNLHCKFSLHINSLFVKTLLAWGALKIFRMINVLLVGIVNITSLTFYCKCEWINIWSSIFITQNSVIFQIRLKTKSVWPIYEIVPWLMEIWLYVCVEIWAQEKMIEIEWFQDVWYEGHSFLRRNFSTN